jgi:hypothetical protein
MSSGYLNSALVAAGVIQSTALALLAGVSYHQVGTCTSTNNGVSLPANQPAGTSLKIRNDGVYTLNIHHPLVGGFINALPATVAATAAGAYQLAPGCVVEIVLAGQNQAYTMNNLSPAIIPITNTYTVLPCQNGATFLCTKQAGGDYTITLPVATIPGLSYKFVNASIVAHAITIGTVATSVLGSITLNVVAAVVCLRASTIAAGGATSIGFTATAVEGDTIMLTSDGVKWQSSGFSSADLGLVYA